MATTVVLLHILLTTLAVVFGEKNSGVSTVHKSSSWIKALADLRPGTFFLLFQQPPFHFLVENEAHRRLPFAHPWW